MEEVIFEKTLEEIADERKYKIVSAPDITRLEVLVSVSQEQNWGLLGAPFASATGFHQAMVRLPKVRIARQSLA